MGIVAAWLAIGGYAAAVFLGAAHHEPWADEAQAWLLARDAGFVDLWTRLLHYEGTPGLWHTVLYALNGLRLPYGSMRVVSAALGLAGAWLMVRRAPLPPAIRLALPFTFFLCYQYVVIARSYALLPPLLFTAALLFPRASLYPGRLAAVLCVLAAVSVHGLVLSASIAAAAAFSAKPDRRTLTAGAAYGVFALLMGMAAWPAGDGTFVTALNASPVHFFEATGRSFRQAFTGEAISSAAVVVLSIPFLRRGGGLLVFALAAALLCGVGALVYAQVWHQALLFLAWVFAIWVSGYRARPDAAACVAIAGVIAVQSWWTVQSIRYDWSNPYSGSREAAVYLRRNRIPPQGLYAIGYACTAVQPYFERNIFANVNGGSAASYWDWSRRNHVNEDSGRLAELRPAYVLMGFKNAYERDLWTAQILSGGYRPAARFQGGSFWKDRVLEPETFDLFRRVDGS